MTLALDYLKERKARTGFSATEKKRLARAARPLRLTKMRNWPKTIRFKAEPDYEDFMAYYEKHGPEKLARALVFAQENMNHWAGQVKYWRDLLLRAAHGANNAYYADNAELSRHQLMMMREAIRVVEEDVDGEYYNPEHFAPVDEFPAPSTMARLLDKAPPADDGNDSDDALEAVA